MIPRLDIASLRIEDLAQILDLQRLAYDKQFHESEESFVAKLEQFPQGAIGCFEGVKLVGYSIGVPADEPWDLGALTGSVAASGSYYLHDVSVAPDHRGMGVAPKLVAAQLNTALGLGCVDIHLIAVQESGAYWGRFGFRKDDKPVVGYGNDASSMRCSLRVVRGGLTVRAMNDADIESVLSLGLGDRAFAVSESIRFYEPDELAEFVHDAMWRVGVISFDDSIVGFLSAHRMSNHWCALDNFYVAPTARASGAGTAGAAWLMKMLRFWQTPYMSTLVDIDDLTTAQFLVDAGFNARRSYQWFDYLDPSLG